VFRAEIRQNSDADGIGASTCRCAERQDANIMARQARRKSVCIDRAVIGDVPFGFITSPSPSAFSPPTQAISVLARLLRTFGWLDGVSPSAAPATPCATD
jgi:hypothetical protein